MGQLVVAVSDAVEHVPSVGRVQLAKYGDGGAHLHLFFLGRPARMLQFRGSPLIDWEENLPRVPLDVLQANARVVAERMVVHVGGAPGDPRPLTVDRRRGPASRPPVPGGGLRLRRRAWLAGRSKKSTATTPMTQDGGRQQHRLRHRRRRSRSATWAGIAAPEPCMAAEVAREAGQVGTRAGPR